jgi:hypothetical protein
MGELLAVGIGVGAEVGVGLGVAAAVGALIATAAAALPQAAQIRMTIPPMSTSTRFTFGLHRPS